jgi:hypothetical protein
MTADRQPPAIDAEILADFRARRGDLWAYCTDLDVQTALALSRALVRAVKEISPEAQRLMVEAIAHEIQVLEQHADAASATVATTLKQYLPAV